MNTDIVYAAVGKTTHLGSTLAEAKTKAAEAGDTPTISGRVWWAWVGAGADPKPARGPYPTLADADVALSTFRARHGALAGTYEAAGRIGLRGCIGREHCRKYADVSRLGDVMREQVEKKDREQVEKKEMDVNTPIGQVKVDEVEVNEDGAYPSGWINASILVGDKEHFTGASWSYDSPSVDYYRKQRMPAPRLEIKVYGYDDHEPSNETIMKAICEAGLEDSDLADDIITAVRDACRDAVYNARESVCCLSIAKHLLTRAADRMRLLELLQDEIADLVYGDTIAAHFS